MFIETLDGDLININFITRVFKEQKASTATEDRIYIQADLGANSRPGLDTLEIFHASEREEITKYMQELKEKLNGTNRLVNTLHKALNYWINVDANTRVPTQG